MKLELFRKQLSDKSTTGDLYVDGAWQCYTLEDVVRPVKVPGETCIPPGEYRVVVTHSSHFDRMLPELVSVPGFSGVRIHSGNTDKDTEGCILVGKQLGTDFVGQSREAFADLFRKINVGTTKGPVYIKVNNPSES